MASSTTGGATTRPTMVEEFDTFSLISATLGVGGYIKPVINFMKAIFALLYFVVAFPWAVVAAIFVERSENPGCYSWSEVGWRCLAGFGIWINGALMFIFVPLEQSNGSRSPYLYLILGYCVGVGILINLQALVGRWFEEREKGKGNEVAQEYWRTIVMLFGVDTTGVKTSATSWSWSMSLFSICLGAIFLTISTAELAEWQTATGKCLSLCSDDGSCSKLDQVPAMFEEECWCCELKVASPSLLQFSIDIGGSLAFYYGITKIFTLFFVWAESET